MMLTFLYFYEKLRDIYFISVSLGVEYIFSKNSHHLKCRMYKQMFINVKKLVEIFEIDGSYFNPVIFCVALYLTRVLSY